MRALTKNIISCANISAAKDQHIRSLYRSETKMSNIEERVIKMVAEQLGVKEDDIQVSSSFVEDLGADSLDTVELIMALEEEFDAEIPDEEAEKIATVEDAVNYIQANS